MLWRTIRVTSCKVYMTEVRHFGCCDSVTKGDSGVCIFWGWSICCTLISAVTSLSNIAVSPSLLLNDTAEFLVRSAVCSMQCKNPISWCICDVEQTDRGLATKHDSFERWIMQQNHFKEYGWVGGGVVGETMPERHNAISNSCWSRLFHIQFLWG